MPAAAWLRRHRAKQARDHLDNCLALTGSLHAIYLNFDESLRRITNQDLFDKLIVTVPIVPVPIVPVDDTIYSTSALMAMLPPVVATIGFRPA